jgi:hypothetical protein
MTGAQAAAYCEVTPTTFAKWVAAGKMPKPILGTRRWDRKAIDHILDKASGITTPPNAIDVREAAWREWERNYEARKAAARPSERQQNAR